MEVPMQRTCDVCGTAYEAQRTTSRYCSKTCNVRAAKARKAGRDVPSAVPFNPPQESGGLLEATRRELAEVDRLDTVLGQQALALAERIGRPGEPGNSVASLSKEFRAVMEQALDGVKRAADPLDELRQRRERRIA